MPYINTHEIATIQQFLINRKKQKCDLVQRNVCVMPRETWSTGDTGRTSRIK